MNIQRPLIVGGASGLGLAMAHRLADHATTEQVYIVDRNPVPPAQSHPKFVPSAFDLSSADFTFFDRFSDADALIITAGFGQIGLFRQMSEQHIAAVMQVNATAVMRLVHRFWPRLAADSSFPCLVMGSISGFMSSPFYAVYGASKAALKIFVESVNVELERHPSPNRILLVAPGSIPGTGFSSGEKADAPMTDLERVYPLADEILQHLEKGDDRFIPHYEDTFREVLERYHKDFRAEGRHSYDYKIQSGRVTS